MPRTAAKRRLYMIGIDSAPLWIIRDFYKKRNFSGFEELMKTGVLMDLESTLPPMTGPSWPSIYTGFRPGEHGVCEFFKLEPSYTKTLVYYDPRIKMPFWERLSEHGLKSLLVTPPMLVTPPNSPNIDALTGFPLPPRYSSPGVKKIADKYAFFGEPEIEAKMRSGEMSFAQCSAAYVDSVHVRSQLSKELIEKNDYDLSFVAFTEQDRMSHFSLGDPKWKDYVLPIYEAVSEFITWVLRKAEREHALVMVVSDHGSQPVKQKFLMNGWLINNGMAHLKMELEDAMSGGSALGNLKYNIREKLITSGFRKKLYYKLPGSMRELAKGTFERGLSGASSDDYTKIHDFDYDMSRTKAFASLTNCPVSLIFINDERFEKGIVKHYEKEKLKRHIMSELLKIKDKHGRNLIVKVYDGDDYYEGTKLFIAPDILAAAREGYILDPTTYNKSGELFSKTSIDKSGDHLQNGIFGAIDYGRKLDYARVKRKHLNVCSIEPTIMQYFGHRAHNDARYKPIF